MDNSWLKRLLQKRLLFVTGKGGTGKSTLASTLALLGVRQGLRVLLVEVESHSTARSIFGLKKTGLVPKKTSKGIDLASVGFQTGIEELVHDVMKVPRVVKVVLRHPVISRFLRATPSALDFVALYLTHRFVEATNSHGAPQHHLVVVDMPAFGHARQMLKVGKTARDLLRVGPMASRGSMIDELVHNGEKTAVVVVTLPEEMPITETIEGYTSLRDNHHVPLAPIFINCTQSKRLDDGEAVLVNSMAKAAEAGGDEQSAWALRYAAERSKWASERSDRIKELRTALPDAEMIRIPLFAGAVSGLSLIENMAITLENSEPEVDLGSV